MVSIADLIIYRQQHESIIEKVSSANLPLHQYGDFVVHSFRSKINGTEHLAVVKLNQHTHQPPLVRLHSECLTGDVFGSARCDCGHQLDLALAQIAEQGGVLVYLRQEGRGIGLANKIKAYALQDQGFDTVEANQHLGFAADQRDYGVAAAMLQSLQVDQLKLLTNNPKKIERLQCYGINVVERIPLETKPTKANMHYLKTKREKLGHLLNLLEDENTV